MRSKVRSPSVDSVARKPGSGRALVATERALFTFSRLSPVNLVVLVRLDGPELGDLLPQALAAMQSRHPLLRARIAERPSRPYFEVGADAAAPGWVGPMPLTLASADDDLDPSADALAVVENEMNTPFDTSRGPLARATYISGGTGSDLVLTLYHSIADGTSTANLVHELLDAPLPLPPPLTDVLPASLLGAGRAREALRFALSQARDEVAYRRGSRQHRRPIPPSGRAVTSAVGLNAVNTASLITRARRRRLTMTIVLSAAVLEQACVNLYGGRPPRCATSSGWTCGRT